MKAQAVALKQTVQPETHAQVRKLSHQLEAVFVNQLFQAMRASIPKDPVLGNAPGAEMFTQIMDEKLAAQASDRLQRGLGENLYRQLARRLGPETPTSAPNTAAPAISTTAPASAPLINLATPEAKTR